MTNYKILFLDIDGTVLKPDDTIGESTKKAVKQVQELGIEVFLATGRPLHEISEIGEELNITSFIGYNGAYAIHNGKDIFKETMSPKTVERYLQISKQHGHEIVMYTNSQNILTSPDVPEVKEFIEKFHLRQNKIFSTDVLDNILGMTLINLKEKDITLYENADEDEDDIHLSQVNLEGFHHSYDVIRSNVNKGFAIRFILELLNIPKEKSIAFGDGMNDKEMLSFVGEGFAMGNAHPDLFPYAKHKTTDVTNSGIFNGLKSLGLVN